MKFSVSVVLCTLLALASAVPSNRLVARQDGPNELVPTTGTGTGTVLYTPEAAAATTKRIKKRAPVFKKAPAKKRSVVNKRTAIPDLSKRTPEEIEKMVRRGMIAVRGTPNGAEPFVPL